VEVRENVKKAVQWGRDVAMEARRTSEELECMGRRCME
jgi:hypothetical protein